MEFAVNMLKTHKLKATPQRIAIYKLLLETNTHPTAENIYSLLLETNPTISLATVYKTLASLKDASLIQELNINGISFHYDAVMDFHPHLICTECNKVIDYNEKISFENLFEAIKKKNEFIVEKEQLYLYGKCKECYEQKK